MKMKLTFPLVVAMLSLMLLLTGVASAAPPN